ncbi:jg25358 [Pararge aegeria aegeria]|uniref:Jg25358 protein n=1 Tax=Pararge aegeria aegeria TaxID=348720 RepID=A0A8S4S261_9NEOP|nr:jg25358 [Pararge aegeria aegeria]
MANTTLGGERSPFPLLECGAEDPTCETPRGCAVQCCPQHRTHDTTGSVSSSRHRAGNDRNSHGLSLPAYAGIMLSLNLLAED